MLKIPSMSSQKLVDLLEKGGAVFVSRKFRGRPLVFQFTRECCCDKHLLWQGSRG